MQTLPVITLTVKDGATVRFTVSAKQESSIEVKCGSQIRKFAVTPQPLEISLPTQGNTLKIEGRLKAFSCGAYSDSISRIKISDSPNLKEIYCSLNHIEALDISECPSLERLECFDNKLVALDLSHNPLLTRVECSENALESLLIGSNSNLHTLVCSGNSLTDLDVARCPNLKMLQCSDNALETLQINGCTQLTELYCDGNELTALDVSSCSNLRELNCSSNAIEKLTLGSGLEKLDCSSNEITRFPLSSSPKLRTVASYNNPLDNIGLDKLYRSLPDLSKSNEKGVIYIVEVNDGLDDNVIESDLRLVVDRGWIPLALEGNVNLSDIATDETD